MIDTDYLIKVKDYMPLPKPQKKERLKGFFEDGDFIPIITVEVEV